MFSRQGSGQELFRRELAADSLETARRLEKAYANILASVDKQLAAVREDDAVSRNALMATQRKIRETLRGLQSTIASESGRVAEKGAATGVKIASAMLEDAGAVRFGVPDANAVKAAASYADSEPFKQMVASYGDYHAGVVNDMILAAASEGADPVKTARAIRRYMREVPIADAQRIARTVQIYSARRGSQETYLANADILAGWVWHAARTGSCMSCLVQHGKRYPLTAMLNDHHSGRCAMVPVMKDDPVEYETGEAWFRKQPASVQQKQMGRAAWFAWQDRAFAFEAQSSPYQNAIYGEMLQAPSLSQLVGEDAARNYSRAAALRR